MGIYLLGGGSGLPYPVGWTRTRHIPSTGYVAASAACSGVGARRARVAAKKTAGIMFRGARRSRPRGPSSRRDRSSAALGRGLFFPTRAFLVFFTCRPRRWRRLAHRAGLVGFVFAKKQALSGQRSRCWVKTIITIRTLSLRRTNACETDRDQPCHAVTAETAAHPRRKKSARDEGRATQRSNG